MENITLNVEPRVATGKGVARSLRREGSIPAVIYGLGSSSAITVNRKDLARIISSGVGGNTVISLNFPAGISKRAIIKDYQVDPITSKLMHADLQEISESKAVHVTVPVMLIGTPEGVKEGGILNHMTHEVEISCLPGSIPAHIDVDVSVLGIGVSVHVSDLKLPEGAKALTGPETVVATVAAPMSAEKLDELLSGDGGTAKEPEVLTKKKEEK